MNTCTVKPLYNKQTDYNVLENRIKRLYENVHQFKDSTERLYESLIKELEDGELPFTLKYNSKTKKSFDSAIDAFIDSVVVISKTLKGISSSKLNEKLNSELKAKMGLGQILPLPVSDSEKADIPGGEKEEESVSYNSFVDDVYGLNLAANWMRILKFKNSLMNYAICDFIGEEASGKIIGSTKDLNISIIKFKNILYNTIKNYLYSLDSGLSFVDLMFDENGELNFGYTDVLDLFKKLLENDNISDIILSEFLALIQEKETPFLNALEAYTNLVYFDDMLKNVAGRTISLRSNKYKNMEVGVYVNKYKYTLDSEHKRKSWNEDSDARTAAQNTSRFSKVVLDYIPLDTNFSKIKNPVVGTVNLLSAFTELFSKINQIVGNSLLAKLRQLRDYIYKFHDRHITYTPLIVDLCANDATVIDALKNYLSPTQLAVFKSLDKYVFAFDKSDMRGKQFKDYVHKTLRAAQTKERRNRISLNKYTILEDICAVIRDCVDSTYIMTEQSFDGKVSVSLRPKSKRQRAEVARFTSRFNIQAQSVPKEIYQEWKNQSPIKYDKKSFETIEFSIAGLERDGKLISFEISNFGELGALTVTHSYDYTNEKYLDEIQETLNNIDPSRIKNIISGTNLTLKEKDLVALLKYVDSRLYTKYLSEDGIIILQSLTITNPKIIKTDLIPFAVKAQVIAGIYNDYDNYVEENGPTKSFLLYLRTTPYRTVIENPKLLRSYLSRLEGIYNLVLFSDNSNFINSYVNSREILFGLDVSSVSKNIENHNDANTSTAYLGAQINQLNEKYRQLKENGKLCATNSLLFTENTRAIKLHVINMDLKAGEIKKTVKNAKVKELLYNSIFHSFFGAQENLDSIIVLPTTYSDKTKNIQYMINTNYKFEVRGKKISIKDMTLSDIQHLYFDTIGGFYKNSFNNVRNKLCKILEIPETSDVLTINYHLAELSRLAKEAKISPSQLLVTKARALNLSVQIDTDYRVTNNGLEFNELLDYNANYLYADENNLVQRLKEEELNFALDLIDSGINFYIGYKTLDLQFNNLKWIDELTTYINSTVPTKSAVANAIKYKYKNATEIKKYISEWVKGNKLIISKNGKLNPLLKEYFYKYSLLSNNLRFALTGSEIGHPDKSKYKKQFIKELGAIDELTKQQFESGAINLSNLLRSPNEDIKQLTLKTLVKIENVAQGTQLKRNVIIPGTMHYILPGDLTGVAYKIKGALMEDVKADVWNYVGKRDREDAHDGSALTCALQSILENNSLQSLEVGSDKKPLWHDYDPETGTATLVKFASFEITNARIRDAMNSNIKLLNIVKKMLNKLWEGEWVKAGLLGNRELNNGVKRPLTWAEITDGRTVYYETPDGEYRKIIDFGRDEQGNYYTKEIAVDDSGFSQSGETTVYHYFDNSGNHFTSYAEGLHTINSLYELWTALGGAYSMEEDENGMLTQSEQSNYLLASFVNNVIVKKPDIDIYDLTQNSYWLPLKDFYIGYVFNLSAVKNGGKNINSRNRWYNNEDLDWFELDSRYLGILMDADHDIEESLLTEFSLVLSALEAGGRLHERAKLVYRDLAKVAEASSKLELDAVAKIISAEIEGTDVATVKSDLYELVGRMILNNIKSNRNDLSEAILKKIERRFGVNRDHIKDRIKLPFSDPSLYSSILSTVSSIINNKSIKRKYPGSGCVMVPAYDMILYFKIPKEDGTYRKLKFDDVLRIARESGYTSNEIDENSRRVDIVLKYLQSIGRKQVNKESFVPTDIVDIDTPSAGTITLELNNLERYYAFQDGNWDYFSNELNQLQLLALKTSELKYFENVTKARNLAPSRITWQYEVGNETKDMNLFLLPEVRAGKGVQKYLDLLAKGYFELGGVKYTIKNLVNEPAEMIISNGYASKLGIEGLSLAEIEDLGEDAFEVLVPQPVETKHWDIAFGKANGNITYITFDRMKSDADSRLKYVKWDLKRLKTIPSKQGALNVWYCDDNNVPLFKVGRKILANNITYVNEKTDEFGKIVEKAKFVNTKTNETIRNTENLSLDENGNVIEYVEYLSKYERTEPLVLDGKILSYLNYDVFLIDSSKINRVFVKSGNKDEDFNNLSNFKRDILDDIFGSSLYSSLLVNPNLSKNAGIIIRSSVNGMRSLPEYFKTDLLRPIIEKINTELIQNKADSVNLSSLNLEEILENIANKFKKDRYSTWKNSLIYTVARIPAQSLLSFMLMQAIAYTGSTKNVVHVSHFQTFLQGSDYDIDKAYVMGFEIGDDGVLVKYSGLMNFSTPELLKESLTLPTPSGLKLTFTSKENGLDITEYLKNIQLPTNTGFNDVQSIHLIAQMLIDINNARGTNNAVNLYYDPEVVKPAKANTIIDYIQKHHENYELSPLQREAAYKVAIAANIGNIVQNIRNADQSYRPISMSDLLDSAENSNKGLKIFRMSLMNPATIFNMQVQNMVGKKVIGIAAVGEKVFFNLSYYWNEGLKSYNKEYLNNLRFQKTFDRILGRAVGEILSVIKSSLANANFENSPNLVWDFASETLINECEANASIEFAKHPEWTEEQKRTYVLALLYNRLLNQEEVDLLISQVLSAATDNAKELILAKINCDENLAKCYIHLLIMGFNIKDIVSFMTSPVVETIAKFADPNMFDNYIQQTSLKEAVDLIKGNIEVKNFLFGNTHVQDENGEYVTISVALNTLNEIRSLLGAEDVNDKAVMSTYVEKRIKGEITESLHNLNKNNQHFQAFADYVENVINTIKETRAKYSNENDFTADITEFENVLDGANETSSLGNVFLGMNQGLATDKESLLDKLKKILDLIRNRELSLQIKFFAKKYEGYMKDPEKNKEKILKLISEQVAQIKANNPKLVSIHDGIENDIYIEEVLLNSLDLIDNFDIEKWLYDVDNYRKRVADYYNLIKCQWNIFDMVNKIPQYKEIIELLKTVYVIDKHSSLRSEIINTITNDLINKFNYVDTDLTKNISNYVNDLLITNFLEEHPFNFPVKFFMKAFNGFGEDISAKGGEFINLTSPEGRASFKRIMENVIVQYLKNGNFSYFENDDLLYLQNNKFIEGLVLQLDKSGVTYLALDLDMKNIKGTPTTILSYLQFLSDFDKLSNVKLGNLSLQDWFILYNMITNQNKYGSDRLTKILEDVTRYLESSILNSYFKYLGELDYNHDLNFLSKLGYNLEDVLLRTAIPLNRVPELKDKGLCYKYTTPKGTVQYYIKRGINKGYRMVSLYPQRDSEANNDYNVSQEIKLNYLKYWTMPMKNKVARASLYTAFNSKLADDITRALLIYMQRGNVQMWFINC